MPIRRARRGRPLSRPANNVRRGQMKCQYKQASSQYAKQTCNNGHKGSKCRCAARRNFQVTLLYQCAMALGTNHRALPQIGGLGIRNNTGAMGTCFHESVPDRGCPDFRLADRTRFFALSQPYIKDIARRMWGNCYGKSRGGGTPNAYLKGIVAGRQSGGNNINRTWQHFPITHIRMG